MTQADTQEEGELKQMETDGNEGKDHDTNNDKEGKEHRNREWELRQELLSKVTMYFKVSHLNRISQLHRTVTLK